MKTLKSCFRTSLQSIVSVIALTGMLSFTVGCSTAETKIVASKIASEIPTAQAYVANAAALTSVILPAYEPIIATVTNLVQADLTVLAGLCATYAQSPSPTVWASIRDVVTKLVNEGAGALLDAAKIEDPETRLKAVAALGLIQTALTLIDGWVQGAMTSKEKAQMASLRTYKLEQVKPYLDQSILAKGLNLSPMQLDGV
jgi:hypothetical protein